MPGARRDQWLIAYDSVPGRHDEQDRCRGHHPAPNDADLPTDPPEYEALEAAWRTALQAATADLASEREVLTCLAETAMPSPFADRTPDQQFAVLERARPSVGRIPIGAERATRAWTRYRDLEEKLLSGFWECHRESYDEAVGRLPEVVAAFETEHAGEIDRASAFWDDVRRRASALGWRIEDPLAGRDEAAVGY